MCLESGDARIAAVRNLVPSKQPSDTLLCAELGDVWDQRFDWQIGRMAHHFGDIGERTCPSLAEIRARSRFLGDSVLGSVGASQVRNVPL